MNYLALSLANIGVEVLILTRKGATKDLSPLENFNNVDVFPCSFGHEKDIFPKDALKKALNICKEHKPDVIHGHHLKSGFIGLAAAAAYDLPMVLTMHKPPKQYWQDFSASPPKYQRDCFETLWHLLATDERIKAHIAYSNIYEKENIDIGVSSCKIQKISHGVPIEFLQHKAGRLHKTKRFGFAPADTLILCPMRPEKRGVEIFIEAAAIVKQHIQSHYQLKFLVTANPKSGRGKDSLKKARDLGLGKDSMFFRNFTLRQMWELFHRAQVCVIPSDREGFSIALLEAMALNTPIVASEVHGNNEAIEDGTSGLLFEPGKPEDLAEKIMQVLSNKNLASNLARKAQERVAQKFSAKEMAEKHLDLYKRILVGSTVHSGS